MFKMLRDKKTQKTIWIILAVIIVPAFIFWGSSSIIKEPGEENNFSLKIFGKRIPYSDYQDSLAAVRNQALLQFGDSFEQMQKFLNLESQAVQRLVLVAEARKRKIKVSDKEVVDFIQAFAPFQNKDQFDNRAYEYILQYVFRTQPRLFEEQTRQNLMIAKLYEAITRDAAVTEQEVKDAYAKENEQISISYIASLYADSSKDAVTSDEELKDYFTKNSLSFKQPLSFNAVYLALDNETQQNSITALTAKEKDLEKAAKELNLSVKETGLFSQVDPVPGIGWSPQISAIISKLDVGQISSVIPFDKKFYVFQLKDRKDPYIPDFEAIKEKVKDSVARNKAKDIAQKKADNCYKILQDAAKTGLKTIDFEKIAKDTGLKTGTTAPFKFGSYIENIGASDEFYTAARSLKDDEFSAVIDSPSGYFIIKTKSKVPVDEAKFLAEKEEFTQKLLSEKKQNEFSKFAEELMKKIQAG
jgi:peptidyl-prolyl cis-trans isomerase D